ncbi:hypothetical protein, partial [Vibrio parahaemolyticus]|uniref:hypothetical protein n=1 Tax=Vibrio parahaemolyticus TaxID=670 RepID=UPI001C611116
AQWFSLGGMRCSPLNAALVLDWHHGKFFGVYRVLFLSLHLVKCAFHVLSGGTICVVFALISPFTVSNFRAISLVWLLWCWEILVKH